MLEEIFDTFKGVCLSFLFLMKTPTLCASDTSKLKKASENNDLMSS